MKKILLVDDEEGIRFLYSEEFRELGYAVVMAANGEEALDRFRSEKPDLVVLDIQMPGMNGIEVLRQMKQERPELPVVLSTAYNEFKQDLGTWASDEYVVKSSDMTELRAVVKKHLG